MAKDDINKGLLNQLGSSSGPKKKGRRKVVPVQRQVEEKKLGRPKTFEGEVTKKLTTTIREKTFDMIKLALATTHKNLTQNELVDMIISEYFKENK